jgi:hypothetical protein
MDNAEMQGTTVTLRTFTVFLWACLIATAAIAGEEHRTHIKIAVEGDGNEHQVIEFDGKNADLDLQSLAVGESKTLTDSNGEEVTVTRTKQGLEFDVDGETIAIDHMLGDLHGAGDIEIEIDGHDTDDVIIKKHKSVRMIKTDSSDGVTIISGSEIDADTRAKIEKVLEEAGKDGDVMFLDGSELHEDAQAHKTREVRIIKKESDVTD